MRRVLRLAPVLLVAALASACTDPDVATAETARAYGFSQVRIVGSAAATFVYCGKDDDWGNEFTAIGPTGVPVHGVVCGGYLGKGSTLRLLA